MPFIAGASLRCESHRLIVLELSYQMVNNVLVEQQVEWKISPEPVSYPDALAFMENRVAAIAAGEAAECIWLLEHPPLYTAGTSARESDLLTPERFPVYQTGRGGEYTYHGPGQRVVYIMLDLNKRRRDVRWLVCEIEQWAIDVCAAFGITAERRDGRVGLWVPQQGDAGGQDGLVREDKIAAIGIRLRRWVSFHGMSLNVNPALEHFSGIVPCGISEHGITSFHKLGNRVSMNAVDDALAAAFSQRFRPERG